MKAGDLVKIEDIGELGIFICRTDDEVCVEIFGERIWITDRVVSLVNDR